MEPSVSSPAKVSPGMASSAMHIGEGSLLAELAILEYFLHQSIILRLDNLCPLDLPRPPAERLGQLRRAQYYSQLIQKMLESLRAIFFGESLPFDESLARRLEVAKLIGLAFFYNSKGASSLVVGAEDDDYWQGRRMTREDREASIMTVFKLATDIFMGNVQMAIELATQVFLLSKGCLPTPPAWAGKEYEQRIAERLTALREAINVLGDEEKATETQWPWEVVAVSLINALRASYKRIEPPIISKFCEDVFVTVPSGEGSGQSTPVPGFRVDEISKRALRLNLPVNATDMDNPTPAQISTMISDQTQTQAQSQALMPSLESDSQFNFMTQPPNVLMDTEGEDAREASEADSEVTGTGRERNMPILRGNPSRQPANSSTGKRHIASHPSSASSNEENTTPLDQNTQEDITNMGVRKRRSKRDRSKGRGGKGSFEPAETTDTTMRSKRDTTSTFSQTDRLGRRVRSSDGVQDIQDSPLAPGSLLSGRLLELTDSMPVISPEAFRAFICRNNDDEIASIMERRHPLVRKFLRARDRTIGAKRKRGSKKSLKSPKRLPNKSRVSSHPLPGKQLLLDRHDSAERIAWSPTPPHGSPSPTRDEHQMRKSHLRNPKSPNHHIAVDRMRAVSRPPSLATMTGTVATTATASFSPLPGGEPRRRRKWSEDETAALICGYNRYGPDWKHILQTYGHHFDHRSNVDLKDRARILKRQGLIK